MKYLNLLSTALLISAVACTDENVVEDLPTNSEEISRTSFEATTIDMVDAGEIGEVQTKTMVREGGEIYWVANDELGVFTNDGSLRSFITKNGGKVTRFENYDEITGEYYVFYPYNRKQLLMGEQFLPSYLLYNIRNREVLYGRKFSGSKRG